MIGFRAGRGGDGSTNCRQRGCTKVRAPLRCESSEHTAHQSTGGELLYPKLFIIRMRSGEKAPCPPPPPTSLSTAQNKKRHRGKLKRDPQASSGSKAALKPPHLNPSVSWLYLARRSERQGAPVLICPVPEFGERWGEDLRSFVARRGGGASGGHRGPRKMFLPRHEVPQPSLR